RERRRLSSNFHIFSIKNLFDVNNGLDIIEPRLTWLPAMHSKPDKVWRPVSSEAFQTKNGRCMRNNSMREWLR
ncbi:MAG: hypothetical protein ACREE6_14295, partial [Limisphaerales bacterium]